MLQKENLENQKPVAPRWPRRLMIAIGAITLLLLPFLLFAQNVKEGPPFAETWKQALRRAPSVDTTPILFSIAGVNYKVPRNYIYNMDDFKGGPQSLVSFMVTYPGFEPLTDKTRDCLTLAAAYLPKGCVPIEFWIGGAGTPVLSDEDHFNNQSNLLHSKTPKQGPDGFEMYEEGGGNMPVEIYRKKTPTHTLLFSCIILFDHQGTKKAVCDNNSSPLFDRNTLFYRLHLDQLSDAQKIDEGLRALAASFTLLGEKP